MSEKERKETARFYIKSQLKDMLRFAKRGREWLFNSDYDELLGMVRYMESVGDITKEAGTKVMKLAQLLRRKYGILR